MLPASERSAAPFASKQVAVSASGVSPPGPKLLLLLLTIAGAALRLLHLGAKEPVAGRARDRRHRPPAVAAVPAHLVVRRGQLSGRLFLADARLVAPGTKRSLDTSALGHLCHRFDSAHLFCGAQIGGRDRGPGFRRIAGVQPHPRLLLAGSSRIPNGDPAGAGIGMVSGAGRRRQPRARLAVVDGVQRACLLYALLRRTGAAGPGMLSAGATKAGSMAAHVRPRRLASGAGCAWTDVLPCACRHTRLRFPGCRKPRRNRYCIWHCFSEAPEKSWFSPPCCGLRR